MSPYIDRETQRLLNEGRKIVAGNKVPEGIKPDVIVPKDREPAVENEEQKNKETQNECPSILDYLRQQEKCEEHIVWEQLDIETSNEDEWGMKCKAVLPDITETNQTLI